MILDEIHLLGADRGPILEVLLSRIIYLMICNMMHLSVKEGFYKILNGKCGSYQTDFVKGYFE